jgi:branched-chain amino acid transport system substrate-binding protein
VNALGLQPPRALPSPRPGTDGNDNNRAWTKRWQTERAAAGKFPTMVQAGVYSGITTLKAVASLKSALTARWSPR